MAAAAPIFDALSGLKYPVEYLVMDRADCLPLER
jgi:hypothetical protein